jgi:hypothetical protein
LTLTHDETKWRKASRSQTQSACVELHSTGAMRDSKNPGGPQLRVSLGSLLAAVKTDQIIR